MTTKYYLGGPMTGLPGFNFPRFDEVAKILRDMKLEILSAHEVDHGDGPPGSKPWSDYLKGDLRVMLGCDGAIFLEGWHKSEGANLEFHVARKCGMEIWEVCDHTHCAYFMHRLTTGSQDATHKANSL